jgi:hypothetical protein
VQTRYDVLIDLEDDTEVWGQVMYMIVWQGKPLSGHTILVEGDQIKRIRIDPNEEGDAYPAHEEPLWEDYDGRKFKYVVTQEYVTP